VLNIRILYLRADSNPATLEIESILEKKEFLQLLGRLDDLCVFSTSAIHEPAKLIRTGARHSCARYFLFPAKLRRKYKSSDYSFEGIQCGVIENTESLFVIYQLPKQGFSSKTADDEFQAKE